MKKIDLNAKPVKYFLNRKKGFNKKQSALKAGYTEAVAIKQTSKIEDTLAYKEARVYFKDEFLNQITMQEIASELRKNVIQDEDRGAKNAAIKIALDKLEPEDSQEKEPDRVIVILQ